MNDRITDQPLGATPIDDVSGLLQDISTREELDQAEAANIINASDWIARGRINDLFTVQFYRTLHTKMFEQVWDWAGALRSQTGVVTHPGSRPELVAQDIGQVAMEFRQRWDELGNHDHLLPFVSKYHHALVLVHPFNNGNGRWSRLAVDAVIQRLTEKKPIVWASKTLAGDSLERHEYISALRAADATNYNPLLHYLGALNPGR